MKSDYVCTSVAKCGPGMGEILERVLELFKRVAYFSKNKIITYIITRTLTFQTCQHLDPSLSPSNSCQILKKRTQNSLCLRPRPPTKPRTHIYKPRPAHVEFPGMPSKKNKKPPVSRGEFVHEGRLHGVTVKLDPAKGTGAYISNGCT